VSWRHESYPTQVAAASWQGLVVHDPISGTEVSRSPSSRPRDVRRAHRPVEWRKPKGGKRRPMALEATKIAIERTVHLKSSGLWHRIARSVPVAGYARQYALDRVRDFREDGAKTFAAVLGVMLLACDIRTGFLGRPPKAGPYWQRYKLRDIAQLALDRQDKSAVRQTRRAIMCIQALGWMNPPSVIRYERNGKMRSDAAFRWLNLKAICAALETATLFKRDRAHAIANHARAAALSPVFPGSEAQREAASDSAALAPAPEPRATGGPVRSMSAVNPAAEILKRLEKL